MDYRHYIDGSIAISRLGFGAWPLGSKHHRQQMSIADGVSLVQSAFNQGINFFDTAPNYGLGLSETILGIALKDVRKSVVINSKFGHHEDDTYDFSENSIRLSVERSLKRLQTNYLDSLLLHNPSMDILAGKRNTLKY